MNHRLPVAPTSLRSLSVPNELAFSTQSLFPCASQAGQALFDGARSLDQQLFQEELATVVLINLLKIIGSNVL